MKLLYCGVYHDYGKAERGPSFEEVNIGDALRRMQGLEVISFHFDVIQHRSGDVNTEFVALIRRERPDMTLIVLAYDDFDPQALDQARKHTTLVSWGCDDHWRFRTGYMQRYAPHFDFCITTYRPAVQDYQAVGQPNVIVSQWGCNHRFFRPSTEGYLYDVSFVGQNYGPRLEIINHLWRHGINVTVFGRRWPGTRRGWKRGLRFMLFGENPAKAGYADYCDLPEIYGRSKINLCLNNNMTGIDNIKGRNFEVPACRGFLLSGPAYGLEEYFEIGKEVVVYQNADDLADKITYYLQHDKEREQIAQAGYECALRDHTYEKRFSDILSALRMLTDKMPCEV